MSINANNTGNRFCPAMFGSCVKFIVEQGSPRNFFQNYFQNFFKLHFKKSRCGDRFCSSFTNCWSVSHIMLQQKVLLHLN